jgi:hypothetical protein
MEKVEHFDVLRIEADIFGIKCSAVYGYDNGKFKHAFESGVGFKTESSLGRDGPLMEAAAMIVGHRYFGDLITYLENHYGFTSDGMDKGSLRTMIMNLPLTFTEASKIGRVELLYPNGARFHIYTSGENLILFNCLSSTAVAFYS